MASTMRPDLIIVAEVKSVEAFGLTRAVDRRMPGVDKRTVLGPNRKG